MSKLPSTWVTVELRFVCSTYSTGYIKLDCSASKRVCHVDAVHHIRGACFYLVKNDWPYKGEKRYLTTISQLATYIEVPLYFLSAHVHSRVQSDSGR